MIANNSPVSSTAATPSMPPVSTTETASSPMTVRIDQWGESATRQQAVSGRSPGGRVARVPVSPSLLDLAPLPPQRGPLPKSSERARGSRQEPPVGVLDQMHVDRAKTVEEVILTPRSEHRLW